jgi:oligopeptide transport system ATP-binding protein
MSKKILLEVKNLKQYFPLGRKAVIKAVDDVSFHIYEGETF